METIIVFALIALALALLLPANEISAACSLRSSKGTYPGALGRGGVSLTRQFDQTGTNQSNGIASIGTGAHEAIPIADIGTTGFAVFQNLDGTNYVELGYDDGGTFRPFVKIKPGRFALLPGMSSAPYAKANTGACDLEYWVIEE